MTLEAMSGVLPMVAVTSRRAYSFLSAGTKLPDCPMTARPFSRTMSMNRSRGCSMFTPGMDSSLSSVPPVCPRPRPDILATVPPQAATKGATIKVVVSPTPPVECLSTLTPLRGDRSTVSPLCIITSVRVAVSRSVIPRNTTAMRKAATW